MFRRHFLLGALATFATPTLAAPQRYKILPKGSEITFAFTLNGSAVKGSLPISQADLRIDPDNLAASSADVSADVRRARTGFVFATEAMKSASVLDAKRFPQTSFKSTRITLGPGGRISSGATLDGRLTLRGVTKPIRLRADLFRAPGTSANDLSRLSVVLTGALNRTDFGAAGYPELVADKVGLTIRANIAATA